MIGSGNEQGVHDLYFVAYDRMHIKGFEFTPSPRAYALNRIVEYDRIYGDDYTVLDDAITGIGNNVSIVFADLDFGDAGLRKLVVHGRAPYGNNPIHVPFSGSEGERG